MQKFKVAIISTVLAAGLTGCANTGFGSANSQGAAGAQESTEVLVQRKMMESAQNIEKTLKFIEKVERGVNPNEAGSKLAAGKDKPSSLPTADQIGAQASASSLLDAKVDVSWAKANADDVLKKLATQIGATYRVSGYAPASIPSVSYSAEKVTVRQALETVGKQVDTVADVVFIKTTYPATIELRFKKK